MKNPTKTLVALLLAISAVPAYADSSIIPPSKLWVEHTTLTNALKNIPDTSDFYQALVDTGVANELDSGGAYTVFAPVNSAFTRVTAVNRKTCLATPSCKTGLVNVLRNHIAYGGQNIADAARNQGGIQSLTQQFIRIGQPDKDYVIDGYNLRGSRKFRGSTLGLIDGVIASNQELTQLEHPDYNLLAPKAGQPKEQVKVTKTIDRNCDAEPGCLSETTTIDRTIVGAPGTAGR